MEQGGGDDPEEPEDLVAPGPRQLQGQRPSSVVGLELPLGLRPLEGLHERVAGGAPGELELRHLAPDPGDAPGAAGCGPPPQERHRKREEERSGDAHAA